MGTSIFIRGVAAIVLAAASAGAWAQDDGDEPNNSTAEAPMVGTLGFTRAARVLNVADEDWYRLRVPMPRDAVTVEVGFNGAATDAVIGVEVQSLAGYVVATGAQVGAGFYRAVTGPVGAGEYFLRVRHVSGAAIADYSIRTFGNDDADEPNDSAAGAKSVGSVGFVRTGRVLNFANQDWYSFQVLAASDPVTVDIAYDLAAYSASVTLEVRTLGGTVLATGAPAGPAAALRAVTGPLAVGEYLVLVRHDGGYAIADYALQAYTHFGVTAPAYVETTVGASIDEPIDIVGGIKPYSLFVDGQFAVPPGLVFDADAGRVSGVAAPAGRYEFMVTCRDAGSPANSISQMMTVVVNAKLTVQLGEFTAFALGKSTSRAIPFTGGTVPFATTMGAALPSGISVTPGQLSFVGTALTAGSFPCAMTVVDAAGLADSVATTAVVCGPIGAFDLAEGDAASGVYFDAVKDSVVTIHVATARREVKRPLRATLLGPDGTTAVTAKLQAGRGTASLTRFAVPSTGRYYLVVAGESGPATGLVAKGKVAPPVKGARRFAAFDADDRMEISVGAVAGAVLTLSAKSDRKGMELNFVGLVDPTGVQVAIAPNEVTTRLGRITLTRTLTAGGTWTVIVREVGGPATMSYTYKLRQPKGVSFAAGE